jgi:hypothetical protein
VDNCPHYVGLAFFSAGSRGVVERSDRVDPAQPAAPGVEDEAAHVVGVRQERRGAHAPHRLPHVLVDAT